MSVGFYIQINWKVPLSIHSSCCIVSTVNSLFKFYRYVYDVRYTYSYSFLALINLLLIHRKTNIFLALAHTTVHTTHTNIYVGIPVASYMFLSRQKYFAKAHIGTLKMLSSMNVIKWWREYCMSNCISQRFLLAQNYRHKHNECHIHCVVEIIDRVSETKRDWVNEIV